MLQTLEQLIKQIKQNPKRPDMTDVSISLGPFYVRYCVTMIQMGITVTLCPIIPTGDIISMNNDINNNVKGIHLFFQFFKWPKFLQNCNSIQ